MNKSTIQPMPEYFDRYIHLVREEELSDALEKSLRDLKTLDVNLLSSIGMRTYAPGKWTVKDILQHITDTERIFCYRTLRFARKDQTPTAGYDENTFAENASADKRDLDDILEELTLVRMGTLALFKSFDEATLLLKGITWKYEMSVLAMGFTLAGHQKHHLDFMKTNYYPLAQ